MNSDLLSLVITLKTPQPVSLAYDQGRALAAEFLDWVSAIDPALSIKLHSEQNLPRPFTVSNLSGLPRPKDGMVLIPKDRLIWFRITSIAPELTAFIIERLIPSLPGEFCLSESRFEIVQATLDPQKHFWAGHTSYQDLLEQYLLRGNSPKIKLHFASPTTFHTRGLHLPYILPEKALGSWLACWNAWSAVTLPFDLLDEADRRVAVSYYNMRTLPVRYGKATLIGGVGQCTFLVVSSDPYWRHVVNALSAFAFYCGTGVKTALGLGQTRRMHAGKYRGLSQDGN